jgi:hypothetical protein
MRSPNTPIAAQHLNFCAKIVFSEVLTASFTFAELLTEIPGVYQYYLPIKPYRLKTINNSG